MLAGLTEASAGEYCRPTESRAPDRWCVADIDASYTSVRWSNALVCASRAPTVWRLRPSITKPSEVPPTFVPSTCTSADGWVSAVALGTLGCEMLR